MSDLVDDFLTDPVVEGLLIVVYLTPVSRHTEPVCRDNTSLAFEVGKSENEVPLAVEDINVRDSEVLIAPTDAFRDADNPFGVVLTALRVVGFFGNRDGRAVDYLSTEPFAQNAFRCLDDTVFEVSHRDEVDTHNKRLAAADNKACVESVVEYVRDEYERGARLVEVGVGRRDETARELDGAGYGVTATDVRDVSDSVDVEFVRDDVTSPDVSVYEDAELVYSVRPPYEIHAALREVAERADADLLVAPLADEPPSFDAELVSRYGRGLFVRDN